MLEVVRVFIHVPNVRNFSFFEISVDVLTDANQVVLVAAGNLEQFQLLLRLFRVGQKFGGGLCVGG